MASLYRTANHFMSAHNVFNLPEQLKHCNADAMVETFRYYLKCNTTYFIAALLFVNHGAS